MGYQGHPQKFIQQAARTLRKEIAMDGSIIVRIVAGIGVLVLAGVIVMRRKAKA